MECERCVHLRKILKLNFSVNRLSNQFVGLKESTLTAWQCNVENHCFYFLWELRIHTACMLHLILRNKSGKIHNKIVNKYNCVDRFPYFITKIKTILLQEFSAASSYMKNMLKNVIYSHSAAAQLILPLKILASAWTLRENNTRHVSWYCDIMAFYSLSIIST
jgi:hypothetical protein